METTTVTRVTSLWEDLMPEQFPVPSIKQFKIWLAHYDEFIVSTAITTMATRLMRESYEPTRRTWDYPAVVKYTSGIMRVKAEMREANLA